MDCSMPGFPVRHWLLELAQTHVHRVGDAIQPSHPLSSPSPPALNLSQHQGLFSNESALPIRKPKYWSFSFNISPSNEYSGLISFRIDWLDPLDCPRDPQEFSPTPQFQSISTKVLSFLYSPTFSLLYCYLESSSKSTLWLVFTLELCLLLCQV